MQSKIRKLKSVPKVEEYIPGDQAWKHRSKLSFGALVFEVFPPAKFLQSCCLYFSIFTLLPSALDIFMTKIYVENTHTHKY